MLSRSAPSAKIFTSSRPAFVGIVPRASARSGRPSGHDPVAASRLPNLRVRRVRQQRLAVSPVDVDRVRRRRGEPASMSRQRSPTHDAAVEVEVRGARAASRIMPGRGLRHGQPSSSSCGHTTMSSSGSASAQQRVHGRRARPGRGCPGRCRAGWSRRRARGRPRRTPCRPRRHPGGAAKSSGVARRQRHAVARRTASFEHPVAVEEDGRPPGHDVEAPGACVVDHRRHRVAQRLGPGALRCVQPSERILSVLIRTTGTSPFQPRSPPV